MAFGLANEPRRRGRARTRAPRRQRIASRRWRSNQCARRRSLRPQPNRRDPHRRRSGPRIRPHRHRRHVSQTLRTELTATTGKRHAGTGRHDWLAQVRRQSSRCRRRVRAGRKRNGLRRYSLHNRLLIALRKPDASFVAGFRAWLKLDRLRAQGRERDPHPRPDERPRPRLRPPRDRRRRRASARVPVRRRVRHVIS